MVQRAFYTRYFHQKQRHGSAFMGGPLEHRIRGEQQNILLSKARSKKMGKQFKGYLQSEVGEVQLCSVHLVRNSLNFVSWKERKEVAADLGLVYTAATVEAAEMALDDFAKKWDKTYPQIAKSWRHNWARVIPFFTYAPEIGRFIYTTNAIESVNFSLRKLIKARASFPDDQSAIKLL